MSSAGNRSLPSGFTLIELSIVLAIIGLIVGGILFGQDLIQSARIRSELTTTEKFSTATATFQGKYGYLPGNIPGPIAAQFGLDGTYTNLTSGYALGDGIVKDYNLLYPVVNLQSGEDIYFFRHLEKANLTNCCMSGFVWANGPIGVTYPQGAFGEGIIPTSAADGHLYFFLGINVNQWGAGTNVHAYNLSTAGIMTPGQAYRMDTKIDDGNPSTGVVYAVVTQTNPTNDIIADTNSSGCLTNASGNTYYLASNQVSCRLMVRAHGF